MFQQARKVLGIAAAVGGLAFGGAALANAATSQGTGTTGQNGSSSAARPAFNGPAPGTAGHEDAEKPVTGSAAARAQAAAVKAVGGGKASAVTSDYNGTGYETTVTKSDGSRVEVHLDRSFNVMRCPGGHGQAPPGAPGA